MSKPQKQKLFYFSIFHSLHYILDLSYQVSKLKEKIKSRKESEKKFEHGLLEKLSRKKWKFKDDLKVEAWTRLA